MHLTAFTLAEVASQAATIVTSTSALDVLGNTTETDLELGGTIFFYCRNMPMIDSSMKWDPRRMMTANLSAMWDAAPEKKSLMRTCNLVIPMTSIEFSDVEQRYTFSASCRRADQYSGKKSFANKLRWASVSNMLSMWYSAWLCVANNVDTNLAGLPIITILSTGFFWLIDFWNLGFVIFLFQPEHGFPWISCLFFAAACSDMQALAG